MDGDSVVAVATAYPIQEVNFVIVKSPFVVNTFSSSVHTFLPEIFLFVAFSFRIFLTQWKSLHKNNYSFSKSVNQKR